ncbi:MAG: 4Fe-4S binding protein [Spirochaetaceae bacterium]|nr:4Fe-4S binding protein [Spirochaetaceae bacterium]
MILTVVFLILFFILSGLLILFVFSVFIPSVNQSKTTDNLQTFLFAEDEVQSHKKHSSVNKLRDTGLRAVVKCSSQKTFSNQRLQYNDLRDCRVFNAMYETEFDCLWQCVGFGSCVSVCPQQAIIIENNTAVILTGCIGCGRCIEICPKNVIELVPKESLDSVIRCCADSGDTSCSDYKKIRKAEIPERNISKITKLCYNLFYGNKG